MTKQQSMTHHFDQAAATWEENPARLALARAVAGKIIEQIGPHPKMTALEFGCGTGLVTLALAPRVKKILAVDTSAPMLGVLEGKIQADGIQNIRPCLLDLMNKQLPEERFDLVFSSMAIHHVEDLSTLFSVFYQLLSPGGQIALADLDAEDGGFHKDVPGVFHLGFDRDDFARRLEAAGFENTRATTAHLIRRESAATGKPAEFPVFLMTGGKPLT